MIRGRRHEGRRYAWQWSGTCIALVVVLGGCKSAGGGGVPTQDGMYDFVARTGRTDVHGTLLWMSGEASIRTATGTCREETRHPDPQAIHYLCLTGNDPHGLAVEIDRYHPLTRSRWRASEVKTQQRRECVRYEIRNNRQVCVQFGTKSYEFSVPVSGPLTFKRRQPQASTTGS